MKTQLIEATTEDSQNVILAVVCLPEEEDHIMMTAENLNLGGTIYWHKQCQRWYQKGEKDGREVHQFTSFAIKDGESLETLLALNDAFYEIPGFEERRDQNRMVRAVPQCEDPIRNGNVVTRSFGWKCFGIFAKTWNNPKTGEPINFTRPEHLRMIIRLELKGTVIHERYAIIPHVQMIEGGQPPIYIPKRDRGGDIIVQGETTSFEEVVDKLCRRNGDEEEQSKKYGFLLALVAPCRNMLKATKGVNEAKKDREQMAKSARALLRQPHPEAVAGGNDLKKLERQVEQACA